MYVILLNLLLFICSQTFLQNSHVNLECFYSPPFFSFHLVNKRFRFFLGHLSRLNACIYYRKFNLRGHIESSRTTVIVMYIRKLHDCPDIVWVFFHYRINLCLHKHNKKRAVPCARKHQCDLKALLDFLRLPFLLA